MVIKRGDEELISIKNKTLELEDTIADFLNERKEIGELYTQLVEKSIKYLGQTTRFYLADLTIDIKTIIDLVKGTNGKNNSIVKEFFERKNSNFDQLCKEWETKKNYLIEAAVEKRKLPMLDEAVLAIRAALKVKDDNYTRRHMDNVTSYSEIIARSLDLSEDEIEIVKTIGYFHDIGKISIPNSILTKPERLDQNEIDVIRKHPKYGADILRTLMAGDYEEVIFGVENHHKKYEEIKGFKSKMAFYCTIVTIADSYDAMTTDRPYRKNMGHDYALSQLKIFSGTQFNPDIVDIVLKTDILNPKKFVVYKTINAVN